MTVLDSWLTCFARTTFATLALSLLAARCSAVENPGPGSIALAGDAATSANQALATAFAQLVEDAIPLEYERRKDWGKTKRVMSGLKFEDFDIKRRQRRVKHGVWKHYRVQLTHPDEQLRVAVDNLHLADASHLGFTLCVEAELSLWARAKTYQYGVHLISLETTATTNMFLEFDCVVGAEIQSQTILPAVAIEPRVERAQFDLRDFKIQRVSDARGPLVKELSKSVERMIEAELEGSRLVRKLNKAIDKRRDKLTVSPADLVNTDWWPLAQLPHLRETVAR